MKRKIWSNRKFCTKVLDMVRKELKRQDCERVIDIYQTTISIYVAPSDSPDGTEESASFRSIGTSFIVSISRSGFRPTESERLPQSFWIMKSAAYCRSGNEPFLQEAFSQART